MRTILIMFAVLLPTLASAQGVQISPPVVRVDPGYGYDYERSYQPRQRYRRNVDCGELRAACMHKDELGEVGQGNCRRYRALCRGG